MNTINDSIRKGPLMTMTLECEKEFPKALKHIMLTMGLEGEAVYKGFPVMDEGQEYWWVQLHLYKNKEDSPKTMGTWVFTNSTLYTSFFDSARSAAWDAIEELGERIMWRLHNTEENLKEEKEKTDKLESTASRLRRDVIDMALELCHQDGLIATLKQQVPPA
jgi:hypothetical protein